MKTRCFYIILFFGIMMATPCYAPSDYVVNAIDTANQIVADVGKVHQEYSTKLSKYTNLKVGKIGDINAVKKAAKKLEKQKQRLEKMQEKMEKAKAKKAALEAKKERAKAKMAKIKAKVDKINEFKAKYQGKIEKAKSKIEKAKEEVNKAKSQIDEAREKVNDAKGKIDKTKNKVNNIKNDYIGGSNDESEEIATVSVDSNVATSAGYNAAAATESAPNVGMRAGYSEADSFNRGLNRNKQIGRQPFNSPNNSSQAVIRNNSAPTLGGSGIQNAPVLSNSSLANNATIAKAKSRNSKYAPSASVAASAQKQKAQAVDKIQQLTAENQHDSLNDIGDLPSISELSTDINPENVISEAQVRSSSPELKAEETTTSEFSFEEQLLQIEKQVENSDDLPKDKLALVDSPAEKVNGKLVSLPDAQKNVNRKLFKPQISMQAQTVKNSGIKKLQHTDNPSLSKELNMEDSKNE